jgi:hypothetical protein
MLSRLLNLFKNSTKSDKHPLEFTEKTAQLRKPTVQPTSSKTVDQETQAQTTLSGTETKNVVDTPSELTQKVKPQQSKSGRSAKPPISKKTKKQ